jgi:hypothetical protein
VAWAKLALAEAASFGALWVAATMGAAVEAVELARATRACVVGFAPAGLADCVKGARETRASARTAEGSTGDTSGCDSTRAVTFARGVREIHAGTKTETSSPQSSAAPATTVRSRVVVSVARFRFNPAGTSNPEPESSVDAAAADAAVTVPAVA